MFPNFWSWHIKLNRIHSGFGKMKSASDVIFVTDVSLLHGLTKFAFLILSLINWTTKDRQWKLEFSDAPCVLNL